MRSCVPGEMLNCVCVRQKLLLLVYTAAVAVTDSVAGAVQELQQLVYPAMQLLLGAVRLVPSPTYFPLHLRLLQACPCLSMLSTVSHNGYNHMLGSKLRPGIEGAVIEPQAFTAALNQKALPRKRLGTAA